MRNGDDTTNPILCFYWTCCLALRERNTKMKTIAFEMKKCKHCKKRCRHKVIIEVNNGWRIVYSECKCCQHYEKKTEVIGEENE